VNARICFVKLIINSLLHINKMSAGPCLICKEDNTDMDIHFHPRLCCFCFCFTPHIITSNYKYIYQLRIHHKTGAQKCIFTRSGGLPIRKEMQTLDCTIEVSIFDLGLMGIVKKTIYCKDDCILEIPMAAKLKDQLRKRNLYFNLLMSRINLPAEIIAYITTYITV
jgi:hypothetical protein